MAIKYLLESHPKIYIMCDGGFANRINSLIGGMHISYILGFYPVICWPVNRWCSIRFHDALEAPSNTLVIDLETNVLLSSLGSATYMLHDIDMYSFVSQGNMTCDPNLCSSISHIPFQKTVYSNDIIPAWVSRQSIITSLNQYSFNKNIISRAQKYLKFIGLESDGKIANYVGLHLRGTDFNKTQSDYQCFCRNIESRPTSTFYVCSDEQSLEKFFSKYPNVITRPKASYTQKYLPNLEWRSQTLDPLTGKPLTFNVSRDRESVIEAIVDLALLSTANELIHSSDSSFLRLAWILKSCSLSLRV